MIEKIFNPLSFMTELSDLLEACPQPDPVQNNEQPVWDLVIADMKARDIVGRKRYGTPLQPLNGRDALQDAYEEALDLAVYLRQEIEERKIKNAK